MTESSIPWGGIVIGDAGPYSDDNWSDIWRDMFTFDPTMEGPVVGFGGELVVSGVASPLGVASGLALVDGKFYRSTDSVSVTVPAPTVDTRIDRIVLRKSWAAQTVRVTRVEGVEGGGAPALTQVDGTTWDIPLAQASITTGGVITVTDEREFLWSVLSLLTQITKRDTPTDGDILVAASGSDGDWEAIDRVRIVENEVFDFQTPTAVATGDGKGYHTIPADLDAYELSYVRAFCLNAPGGGPITIQIHNVTNGVDMLSTELTIDDGDTSSIGSGTPAVINAANDDVDNGDVIRIDVDAANGADGLIVECGYRPR